jgi:hypothetical protein
MQTGTIDDIVPAGVFYSHSNFTDSQIRAIQLANKIGKRLAQEHPEIAELYRQGGNFQRYIDIATQYIPDSEQYLEVASKAVGYAIRSLIPKEERKEICSSRNAQRLENFFGGFESENFIEHCKRAAKKRHEGKIGVDVNAMLKGRGRTTWSEEEKRYTIELTQNPQYQHQTGSQISRPNYELIALELNIQFHNCKEVRYSNSVASFVRDTRRAKK